MYRLPASTALGPVTLQISSLQTSLDFYEHVLGFRAISRDAAQATLAAQGDNRALIVLHAQPGAVSMPSRGRLGLYHLALLLPDRASLGRFARHLEERGVQAGAADHLVSEAFYLTDPDGLGIEVYADRARETWQVQDGEFAMATDPIDLPALRAAAGDTPWVGLPAGTRIGHIHLHVGDLAESARFFSEALGFDPTVRSYPSALFLSAGGYHHHVGTNLWAGRTAVPPEAGDARLLEWTIEVPADEDVDAVAVNLAAHAYAVTREAQDALISDPWGTPVRIRTASVALRHAVPRAGTS